MSPTFEWAIDRNLWKPKALTQETPVGPTMVETIRECGLRALFGGTKGYEPRSPFSARIGTAFHKTVESFSVNPVAEGTAEQLMGEARKRFDGFLEQQVKLASERPREALLPRDEQRVLRTREAAMVEVSLHPKRHGKNPNFELKSAIEREVEVRSLDGLFRGFIDFARRVEGRLQIADYKSATHVEGLPDRYQRQIQMYAAMWSDSRGEWPDSGHIRYPSIGISLDVPIRPSACTAVMVDSRNVVDWLASIENPADAATPGAACRYCEFRPWCEPFWKAQALSAKQTPSLEDARIGFEGQIEEVRETASASAIVLPWGPGRVQIAAQKNRFPVYGSLRVGDRIRGLDFNVQGVLQSPRALPTDFSELYIVHGR